MHKVAYRVATDVFEGPLDLLLHLVSRQKVDIHDVSITDLADDYIAHIDKMADLDLDVASEFLLVAATLMHIKSASLLPRDVPQLDEEFDEMSPEEAREILVGRLLAYRKFKNVTLELAARHESQQRMHPRYASLEEPFLKLMPDYLEGITLRTLGVMCAELHKRREVFLLEAEHVAARPISLDEHIVSVERLIRDGGVRRFADLLPADVDAASFVVTFLALLELFKRGVITIGQDELFAEITLEPLHPNEDGGDFDAESGFHDGSVPADELTDPDETTDPDQTTSHDAPMHEASTMEDE